MTKNTRVHVRVGTDLEASYRLEGSEQWLAGRVANLSAGGVGLLTEEPIEPMTTVAGLRFALPGPEGQKLVEVSGLVLHSQATASPEPRGSLNGVHLMKLAPATFETIRQYVWSLLGEARQE